MRDNHSDTMPPGSEDELVLSVEAVSAVFAHDIATPLTTARLNADLIAEYWPHIRKALENIDTKTLPPHIRAALEQSPTLVKKNLETIQKALSEYKDYLNALQNAAGHDAGVYTPRGAEPLKSENLSILLVDDEGIHHDIAEAVLGAKHDITHADGGLAALERCRSENFDIILLDLKMPELSGRETAERLRDHIPRRTWVIGLSNMPIENLRDQYRQSGFHGFLDKPLKLTAFSELVAQLHRKVTAQ